MAKINGAVYAVLIVMALVFVVGTVAITFSGYATAGSQIGAPSIHKFCYEHDSGMDTRGGIRTWNDVEEKYDKCVTEGGRYVQENWCTQDGDIRTEIIPCQYDEDRCKDGVCSRISL